MRADNGAIVAQGGAYEVALTVPGGAQVPMSGVTWVAVETTHRRRGLLRSLMAELEADAGAHDEPLLGLTASEGGIYERFGYGMATRLQVSTIDRRRADFRDGSLPEPGEVRITEPSRVLTELHAIWDRFAPTSVGEITRPDDWFELMLEVFKGKNHVVALHRDGYAIWFVEEKWNDGHPESLLHLWDFAAATPDAHRDLWKTVLSVDLVGTVRSVRAVAPDDPLRYLLTDPRAVRTVENNDNLWVCPRDPIAAFSARAYRIDDAMTVAIDDQVLRIATAGTESAPDATPDLVTTRAGAGALLMGAVAASDLAAAGRLTADSPATLGRADAFFGWAPRAHLRTGF